MKKIISAKAITSSCKAIRTAIRKHPVRTVLLILLFLILYLILGTTLPFLHHPAVSADYRKQFDVNAFTADSVCTEQVACISDNKEALLLRLRMFEAAKEEIILSTFEMHDDNSGRDVFAALYAAAKRGVSVRLIIDGLLSYYRLPDSDLFAALAAHPNVTVRFYNPVNLLLPWRAECRLHDKYIIVDDTAYLLGGRNTYDLFLGDYTSSKNEDRELFVMDTNVSADSSIHALRDYFASIWDLSTNHTYKGTTSQKVKDAAEAELLAHYEALHTTYPTAFAALGIYEQMLPTNAIHLLSNPVTASNKMPTIWYSLSELMKTGQTVYVQTPYVICSNAMYEDLTAITEQTQVNIITNDVNSGANPFGCTDYLNEKDDLLETGVTMYEYHGAHSLHTKTVLIDDRLSIVGSYNMDMRSTYLDTELMLVVDSKELNALLMENVDCCLDKSRSPNADGSYTYGSTHEEAVLPDSKKRWYPLLRVVIRLFRHLL